MNRLTQEFLFETTRSPNDAPGETTGISGIISLLPDHSHQQALVQSAEKLIDAATAKSPDAGRVCMQTLYSAAAPHSNLAMMLERKAERLAPDYYARPVPVAA